MTLLVALIALTVFIAFAYNYMQESRLRELLERHQLHPPLSPRTLRDIDGRSARARPGHRSRSTSEGVGRLTSDGHADEPVGKSG